MQIDLSLIGDTSASAAVAARQAEQAGFDGVWATESVTDAFLQSLAAITNTEQVQVGTAIAVAFSRSPMTTAYAVWDLAACSNGRFILGMGSQVRAHIERRFDMPWSSPVDRMRDYLGALDAIWTAWRTGERLDYRSETYQHTLMSPVFTPPLHDHRIPIALAAVGPRMTELAGERCDGVILHGMTNPGFLDTVSLPAIDAGLARSGRQRGGFFVSCPLFMVMGDDERTLHDARRAAVDQLAFYASTPAYRGVLEAIGYGELQPALQTLSREGRWQEMGGLLDDTFIDAMILEGRPEDMPRLTYERFGTRLDRTSSYFGWPIDDPDRLRDILAAFRSFGGDDAGS